MTIETGLSLTQPDAPLTDLPAIETRGLTRTYGTFTALDELDLWVAGGEILGILGPNGSGKSTTVRILCTLLAPSSGTATVLGNDVVDEAMSVRRLLGASLQEASLDDLQTGSELLLMHARLQGASRREARAQVDEVAALLDLGAALGRRVGTYSGGMRRRLDLGVAIVHRPRVLILDEPTVGLDPESRERLWTKIEQLRGSHGMTVVLTTQYLEEADRLCDRVVMLREGRVVLEGAPGALKRQVVGDTLIVRNVDPASALPALGPLGAAVPAATDEVRIIVADAAVAIAEVVRLLDSEGVAFGSLEIQPSSLEDVYWSQLVGGAP